MAQEETEEKAEAATKAVNEVIKIGKAMPTAKEVRAKRCFSIKCEEDDKELVKWVVAAPKVLNLMPSLEQLRVNKVLEVIGIKVEEDRATPSKAAKEVQKLVFQDSGKKARRGGRKRRKIGSPSKK